METAPHHNARGSITLVALCLSIAVAIALGSYVALCQRSLDFSTRNLQLSKARQLAETGLEEALWALNNNTWYNSSPNTNNPVSWTTTWAGPIMTSVTGVSLPNGYDLGEGATGTLTVTVDFTTSPNSLNGQSTPLITSVATVTVPSFSNLFTKTLIATTKPAPLFPNALGIVNPPAPVLPPPSPPTYAVIFSQTPGTTWVDSWNSDSTSSLAPTLCVPGSFVSYPSAPVYTNPVLCNAVIAAPNITFKNTMVYGYATTFGDIISKRRQTQILSPAGGAGIDSTRVGKSAFVPNFTVAVPAGSTSYTFDGTINTTLDSSVSPLWDVSSTDLTLNGTVITIIGHVVIRVSGDLTLINGGQFNIQDGAQLEIFVGSNFLGGNVAIGQGSSDNAGFVTGSTKREPKNLALYSMNAGSRTFLYSSTRDFCGVVYSASTYSVIEFQSNFNFYGAILANYNIVFDPGFTPAIHYDTALQYLPKGWFASVQTPFMIVQVSEPPP